MAFNLGGPPAAARGRKPALNLIPVAAVGPEPETHALLSETSPVASAFHSAAPVTCRWRVAAAVATPDPARLHQQGGPKGQIPLRGLNQAPLQKEGGN
ncbi:hypothetical protein P7K49_014330 [Saguinus oedipus]|uniref:Uncharacterized protein n=1 Tax=Saguinus oedipus TaxID=9490 RepID=A0ABQ9VJ29_SAGOE|nr:hypothetical protein P7K49_014330 [Saguinus oedipus]